MQHYIFHFMEDIQINVDAKSNTINFDGKVREK